MSTTSKILIVGAGIGGLCAASALAQIGMDVDVIEIKPENTVPGVGFGLRTNALRALREIGLYDQCLSIGFPSPSLTYYDQIRRPCRRTALRPAARWDAEQRAPAATRLSRDRHRSRSRARMHPQDVDDDRRPGTGRHGSVRDVQRRDVGPIRRGDRFRRHQIPDSTGAVRAEVRPGSQRRRGVADRAARSGRLDSPDLLPRTGGEGRVRAACRRHDVHAGHPFRARSTPVRSRRVPPDSCTNAHAASWAIRTSWPTPSSRCSSPTTSRTPFSTP